MYSLTDVPGVRRAIYAAEVTGDGKLLSMLYRVEAALILESPSLWSESVGEVSDLLLLERGLWG